MTTFTKLNVVKYDTGITYMVCENSADLTATLLVKGWKNNKPFGAIRHIDPARCELIGNAIRPQERGDSWGFTKAGE